MKKFISGLALAAMLALPLVSSAATFSNVQFDNGDVTISGQGGSTVNATFHIVVPSNQVVEKIQTDVLGDNLAAVCTDVGGDKGLEEGTYDVTLPIKLPPNTGTYTLSVQGSGVFGGFRTVDCSNDVVGTGSFSSSLKVVSNSSTVVGGTTSSPAVGSWQEAFAALTAQIQAFLHPTTPTPTTSAVCTAYTQAKVGTQYGVVSDQNAAFQGFLLSQHASIPALKAGAAFGLYLTQTQAADSWFNSMNHCQ